MYITNKIIYNILFIGKTWSTHRRIIGPNLSELSIRSHINIFNECILENLAKMPTDGKPFDVLKGVTTCNLVMFMRSTTSVTKDSSLLEEFLNCFHK